MPSYKLRYTEKLSQKATINQQLNCVQFMCIYEGSFKTEDQNTFRRLRSTPINNQIHILYMLRTFTQETNLSYELELADSRTVSMTLLGTI